MTRTIRALETVWIPLSDGCRLAARIWLPEDAAAFPVPAILEAIPYRRRDMMRERDEQMHPWFAARGYACVRVDLRGSGDSEGILRDEYLEREQQDNEEVLAWLAAQPWCSGRVGMIGKSWGGFAALQLAARRPPELGAVIAVCASDDRYADDAHYMGGCLLTENLNWGSIFLGQTARPPDPAVVGEGWRELWRRRLEALRPFAALWLEHPWRDDYWRHGSVRGDAAGIPCPLFVTGGWADGYRNPVPRLLAGAAGPRRGLMGPWAHIYPHEGRPGPAVDFLGEALAFWDRWLHPDGGEGSPDTDEGPFYRVWMPHGPPQGGMSPGHWVAESAWPSPRIEERRIGLGAAEPSGMTEECSEAGVVAHRSPQSVGVAAGVWTAFGAAGDGEEELDQSEDDRRSLVFDFAALGEPIEILGDPAVELELAVDRPVALVAARLCDVSPDGASYRVSYGLANLCHLAPEGATDERPLALLPGAWYRVRIELLHAAWHFAAGHRVRLALSTAYWPIVWPSPETVTVRVRPGASALLLPVRPPASEDAHLPALGPPRMTEPEGIVDLVPDEVRRTVERSGDGTLTVTTRTGGPAEEGDGLAWFRIAPIELETGTAVVERFSIRDDDPLSARGVIDYCWAARREGWSVRVSGHSEMRSTAETFELTASLDAFEGGQRMARRRWRRSIPRRLV